MPEKLKPCPFCGSKDVEIFEPIPKNAVGRAIVCKNCNVRVGFPTAYDDVMAAEEWNRRVDNDKT